jgi:hypothetical protein
VHTALLPALSCLFFITGSSLAATDIPDDRARMRMAAEQLVRGQLPSGLFSYEYDFETGALASSDDLDGVVLVRQSFAAFVLAQYAARFHHPPALDAVRRFLEGSAERSLPIGKGKFQSRLEAAGAYNEPLSWMFLQRSLNLFGLLYSTRGSGQLLSADNSYELAYPGATALALAAGLLYTKATEDHRFDELLAHWVEGLLAVQVPGRGFREVPHHLAESDYLNGEAWLALAMYAEAYPRDRDVAEVLASLDSYLLERYYASSSKQFFHWGSMASALRAEMTDDARFDDFLTSLTEHFLSDNAQLPDGTSNSCHIVEGLASVSSRTETIQGAGSLMPLVQERITRLMVQNRLLQIDVDMKSRLALDERGIQGLGKFAGGFLSTTDPPRMRLDTTGHCLNALLIMEGAGLIETPAYIPQTTIAEHAH